MKYHYYPSKFVWEKAEEKLISQLKSVLDKGKRIALFLSGGSVVRLYPSLSRLLASRNDLKQKLIVGQVDERILDQKSKIKNQKFQKKDINAEVIGKTGLWKVCRQKEFHM